MAVNDIFVSYRRKDINFVRQIVDELQRRDKSLWVDWDDIPPGVASFSDEIERGINSAHTFLAILSPDYLESEYCLSELEHANRLNKRIIPIVYEKFENMPVPESIRLINWIYFTPHAGQLYVFSTAMDNLSRAIESDYEHIQEHTRLLQRALEWRDARKNSAFLPGGKALRDAETWLSEASHKSPAPSALHSEFIFTARRHQTNRQRRLLFGAFALLTITVIALIIALQQFFVATRRADETLSLLIADDALNANRLNDPLTALSRIYYANTFIDNPPSGVQSTLQQIAFQPAPLYVFNYASDNVFPLPAETGTEIPINEEHYFLQDSDSQMTIRDSNAEAIITFDAITIESRDDSRIHPDVMAEIQNIHNNSFGPFSIGYDMSPDGNLVAMGREGTGILIWNNASGAGIQWTLSDHNLLVDNVQFSADGNFMISVASDLQNVNFGRSEVEIFIWETSNWTVVQPLTAFDSRHQLAGISPDMSKLIFSDASSNDITVWDNTNGARLWQTDTFDFVQDIAFSEDSQNLIASTVLARRMAPPDSIRIYDTQSAEEIAYYDGINSERIIGLPILPGNSSDSLRLLLNDGSVRTLDFSTDEEISIGTIEVRGISGMSDNGRFIASENFETSELLIHDLDSAEEIARVPVNGWLRGVSISPTARFIAYTLENPDTGIATVIIHDTSGAVDVMQIENVPASFVARAHLFAEDGRFIYSDRENLLHILSAETFQHERQFPGFLQSINDIAYQVESERLAVAGEQGAVMVWDSRTGDILFQLDNAGTLALVALTSDGKRLATANENGQISLWRLFNPEESLIWVEHNRAILDLSCADRSRYGIANCD